MDKFTLEQRYKADFLRTSGSVAGVSSVTVPAVKGLEQHFGVSLSFRTLIRMHDTDQLQKHCVYFYEKMGDVETN